MESFENILANMNRRKTIRSDVLDTKLSRCLSTFDLTFIGIGYVIGAGVFVLSGAVAAGIAGPAVDISIIIAAVSALFSALCYAEFCCRVPQAGSAYLYAYLTTGEIWAFIIGWNMLLEYLACAASLARVLSATIDAMFDDIIKNITVHYIMNGKEWNSPFLATYPDFLAAFMILIFTIIVLLGVRTSLRVNLMILAFAAVCIIILEVNGIIFIGLDFSNWTDYGGFFPYGMSGVLTGSAKLFFLYAGFEVICISSEECRNPVESVPRALGYSVFINAALNVIMVTTLTLMVPWCDINAVMPWSYVFKEAGKMFPQYVVVVGLTFAVSGSILVTLHATPRFVYAMASDGLLFAPLARISDRNRVPGTASLIICVISISAVLFIDLDALIESLNIGSLVCYTIVAGSVIILRYRPEHENSKTFNKQECTSRLLNGNSTDNSGTLKSQFECLTFLKSDVPGRIVAIATIIYALWCACAMTLLSHSTNDITNGYMGYIILLIISLLGSVSAFTVILMHHQNNEKLSFQVPFVPYIPAFSMMFSIMLLVNLSVYTWIRFVVWIFLGLIIYTKYGYHHSKAAMSEEALSEQGEENNFTQLHSCDEQTSIGYDYGVIELVKVQPPDVK